MASLIGWHSEVTGKGMREMGKDLQQRATGLELRTRSLGQCSEDKAPVYGTPALPTELLGRSSMF